MSVSTEEVKVVEDKVKELLRALQLDVHLSTETEEKRLYFNVTGPDARSFLRNKDEILKSISLLLQTVHQAKFDNKDLEIRFDANGTLLEREKEVRAMAFNAVEQLGQDTDVITLEPLNPYERRIVHMTLSDRKDLITESVGDGHFKRLRIRLGNKSGGDAVAEEKSERPRRKPGNRSRKPRRPMGEKREPRREKPPAPEAPKAAKEVDPIALLGDGPVSDF